MREESRLAVEPKAGVLFLKRMDFQPFLPVLSLLWIHYPESVSVSVLPVVLLKGDLVLQGMLWPLPG